MSKRSNISSRMIITALTLLILSLLTACDPVSYPALPEQQIESSSESTVMPASKDSVYVAFKPILGAVRYGYTISASEDTAAAAADEQFWPEDYSYDRESGLVFFTINNALTGYTYNISILAEDASSNILEIARFDNYTVPNADISKEVPAAYISRITEDSVEISFEHEISAGNMDYLAIYTDRDGIIQEQQAESIPFTVRNFSSGDIIIYQKYKAEESFDRNSAFRTLTVSTEDVRTTMTLTIEGSSFTITGAPADTEEIEIRKITDNGEINIASGKAEEAIIYPVFDYGQFRAVAISSEGRESAVSNSAYSVLPVVITSETTRQQSYVFTFEVSPDIDLSSAEAITSIGKAALSQSEDIVEVTVSGLISRQTYNTNVHLAIDAAGRMTIPVSFTTPSFAGKYEWTAANPIADSRYATSFSVTVEENDNPDSEYKYYIYSDEEVKGAPKGRHRIMPLIDPAVDIVTESPLQYSGTEEYKLAYQWNNKKWNASPFSPKTWYVASTKVNSEEYISIVNSVALGTSNFTTTRFSLTESDGTISLVFYNKITEGLLELGNGFLRKNPDAPVPDDLESDEPFTFTLSYTGAAE